MKISSDKNYSIIIIICLMLIQGIGYGRNSHVSSETEKLTRLIGGMSEKDLSRIKELIKAGANPDIMNDNGDTPLSQAIDLKSTKLVQMLLYSGANVNLRTGPGAPPLFVAAAEGYSDIVNILLKANAKINSRLIKSKTFFSISKQKTTGGSFEKIALGIAETIVNALNGGTALYIATANNKSETALLLINAKANVNIADFNGVTPLMHATSKGNVPLVKALLKAKAKVNTVTRIEIKGRKMSALSIAIDSKRFDLVKLLKDHGAITFKSK